jgi:uncharacterized protein (TIGR03382 family)
MEGLSVQLSSDPAVPLAALVGQQLTLQVAADGGADNTEVRSHTLTIGTEPLVTVRTRTDAPVAEEGGLLGVQVQLESASACALTGLALRGGLEGLDALVDSARLDGAPVAARLGEDGTLWVEGLALEPGSSHLLTFSARPRLYGKPALRASVELNGVDVTVPPETEEPAPGTCGCSEGGEGASAAAGLLALAALLRRRGAAGRRAAERPRVPCVAPRARAAPRHGRGATGRS